jgi:hypothetical protein
MRVSQEDTSPPIGCSIFLSSSEAALVAAGKTRSMINTYVDRRERFLKRVVQE